MRALTVLGLGLLAVAGAAAARSREGVGDYAPQAMELGEAEAPGIVDEFGQWAEHVQDELSGGAPVPMNADSNVRAALRAVQEAEGTAGQADPYRVCYGYRWRVQSFADHPAVTGEWSGEPLPDAMCSAAGFGPGCVSTAAGAYQIKKATWLRVRDKLRLPDFSPASQDAAAVELLRARGALDLIRQGRFLEGMARAAKEWASLPGAGYGQGERTAAWLQERYVQAGGVLA